jgi:threonine/homoserine/homoserine lactone efflux protein
MPNDALFPLITLMLAMFWTPGPNNALLALSGLKHGFRLSIPHLLGVSLGFTAMLLLVAFGAGGLFRMFPALAPILKWIGVGLMLWLAWKIGSSGKMSKSADAKERPWTFMQATAFQAVNPKGWVICISVISQFITGVEPLREAAVLGLVSTTTGTTSAIGWVAFGVMMQRWLDTPARLRMFNLTMAALIVASVGLLFLE